MRQSLYITRRDVLRRDLDMLKRSFGCFLFLLFIVPNIYADTPMDMTQWLAQYKMQQYAERFKKNAITTQELVKSLTESDLESMGISILGHRKILMGAIEDLQKNGWEQKWSVAVWLKEIGLEQYTESFTKNAVTSQDMIVSLTDTDLKSIGISILGHRKMILDAIANLNANDDITNPSQATDNPSQSATSAITNGAPTNDIVVEVHQSHTGTNLWYHVGQVDPIRKTIQWGSSQKYDRGQAPMCDFDGNTIIEVHQGHDDTKLWYRVGSVNERSGTIDWGASVNYDKGQTPIVAMNGDLVVEIHQSHAGTNLWYHVGILNKATRTISWGESHKFDQGRIPSVGFAEAETDVIVEVHQSHTGTNLWYHVGTVNRDTKTIDWGDSHRYDQGALPMCDFNGQVVVEVHQGHDDLQLWYRIGKVNERTKTIAWENAINYDRGKIPTVAINGNVVIEMHQSHEGTNLWYKVGTLDPNAMAISWGQSHKFDQGRIPSIGF